MTWYQGPGTPPVDVLWWAVEHLGHPAFYLRALKPGDFAPDRLPLARHAYTINGTQVVERGLANDVVCCTCHDHVESKDLEPIERKTGLRGHVAGGPSFLDVYRLGRKPWPSPTDPRSCWLCSNPRVPADREVGGLRVCAPCARHLERK